MWPLQLLFMNVSQRYVSNVSKKHGADGARVFVTGLADTVRWTDLKDHFKLFGAVAYASVSEDMKGNSKCCGIVQYESPDDAIEAINNMRKHPLHGNTLYVREDIQDRNKRAGGSEGNKKDASYQTPRSPPSIGRKDDNQLQWRNEGGKILPDSAITTVQNLLEERDSLLIKANAIEIALQRKGILLDLQNKTWSLQQ